MKVIAALLLSGMGITAGPVPVPNPLFHEPKARYPNIGPAYSVPYTLFSERNAYPYRESNPYLSEPLLSEIDSPLSESDLYSGSELASSGGLTADRLTLTNLENSQLLELLMNNLGQMEGNDYAPLGYGPPQNFDPDLYEELGLASPYDGEDAEDEYEGYMDEINSWPQANIVPQMASGRDMRRSKKADSASATAAAQASSEKPAAADNGTHESDHSDNKDDKDSAENLVKQIDALRESIKRAQSQGAKHFPSKSSPSSVPVPSTTTTTATPAAAELEKSGQTGSGEAVLADQLRAAASEPSSPPQKISTEAETAYETIKRFLVMEDALKRVS